VPPPTPTDRAALVRGAPDALFLDFATVDERTTLCFAFGAGQPVRAFALKLGRSALEARVARWRESLLGGTLEAARQEGGRASSLYHDLLGPVEAAGLLRPDRVARLVVIPDGPLRDLPFAALRDGMRRHLIERLPLSGALALAALAPSAAGTTPRRAAVSAGPSLLCAVDPLAPRSAARKVAVAAPTPSVAGTRTTAVRELRRGYLPLMGARAEADALLALFPNGLRLQGAAATEAQVKARAPGRDILHFATHAMVDRSSALDSWLLLAPDPQGTEDGRLEAREVSRMALSARLAVLSACDTGVARPGQGGGLLGFAWAFRAAGCPSVVASLWGVDDAATSRLMAAFYAGLKAGRPKDEALRAAMLSLERGGDRTQRPFYWAAWQVIGDASPLTAALGSAGRHPTGGAVPASRKRGE
jgi:CHAT domain-containing protein